MIMSLAVLVLFFFLTLWLMRRFVL